MLKEYYKSWAGLQNTCFPAWQTLFIVCLCYSSHKLQASVVIKQCTYMAPASKDCCCFHYVCGLQAELGFLRTGGKNFTQFPSSFNLASLIHQGTPSRPNPLTSPSLSIPLTTQIIHVVSQLDNNIQNIYIYCMWFCHRNIKMFYAHPSLCVFSRISS